MNVVISSVNCYDVHVGEVYDSINRSFQVKMVLGFLN